MTVSTTTARVSYTGNGVTTIFAVPFPFIQEDYLTLVLLNTTTLTETTLVLNSVGSLGYTVGGAGQATGSVTLVTAPTGGEVLTIFRSVPATQESDFVANDPFPAEVFEDALDKLTMIVGQAVDDVDRALKLFDGDVDGNGRYDANGNRIVDMADGINPSDGATVGQLIGAGSGNFIAAGVGATTRTMQNKARDFISVKDYGATGDGSTDDTLSIQAAITAATGRSLYFPAGTYRVTSAITITTAIDIFGAGTGSTIIKTASGTADIFTIACGLNVVSNVTIRDMTLDADAIKTNGRGIFITASSGGTLYFGQFRNIFMSDKMFEGFRVQSAFFLTLDNITVASVQADRYGFFFRGIDSTSKVVNVWMRECKVLTGVAATSTGGLFIDSYSEGFYVSDCTFESTGLNIGVYVRNTLSAPRPPENLWFSRVVCDNSADNGWIFDDAFTVRLAQCWGTSCVDGYGLWIAGGRDIEVSGFTAIGNGEDGVRIGASTKQIRILGGLIDANGQKASDTYSGVLVDANATDFTVRDVDFFREGTTKTHQYDVNVLAGTSDRYFITHNRVRGGITGSVSDNGSGVNKFVEKNIS